MRGNQIEVTRAKLVYSIELLTYPIDNHFIGVSESLLWSLSVCVFLVCEQIRDEHRQVEMCVDGHQQKNVSYYM